ncbi:MAG: hypothetical protein AB1696_24990 [Planctomycetota bacterium]
MRRLIALSLAGLAGMTLCTMLSADEKDGPYLMSVSFSVPRLEKWTAETVDQFHASPYDGVAVKIPDAYARTPAPKLEDLSPAVQLIKSKAKPGRHVWPWIFLTRIIAPNPEKSHQSASKKKVDVGFKGMDLDGLGGALEEYCNVWRLALRLAREFGAPGIVFDPEAYNDYSVDSLRYLSQTSGKPVDEVERLLRAIGTRMADIAAEEFPDAIIWSLFTQFQVDPDLCTMPTILFDAMLMRAREKNIPLVLVDGGETVGYAFINLDNLDRHHKLRALQVAPLMEKYGGRLVMGCTISPWADAKERTGWMAEWPSCVNSTFKTIADFEPVFVTLMRRYRHFWIYAASAAPYDPLKPESASRYNPTLLKARAEAKRLGPLPPYEVPKLSDLANAQPFTKDLAEDAAKWSVGGGPEASPSALPPEDGPGVRFMVNVDTNRRGEEKYPAGWLFLNRDLGDAIRGEGQPADLGEAVGLRFQIRFRQEGKIRVGLREKAGATTHWVSVFPKKAGEWKDVAIPIELFALEDRRGVTRISFYVAEGWYAHGDKLTFDIRKMAFCK